jgi:hypothetical protein
MVLCALAAKIEEIVSRHIDPAAGMEG